PGGHQLGPRGAAEPRPPREGRAGDLEPRHGGPSTPPSGAALQPRCKGCPRLAAAGARAGRPGGAGRRVPPRPGGGAGAHPTPRGPAGVPGRRPTAGGMVTAAPRPVGPWRPGADRTGERMNDPPNGQPDLATPGPGASERPLVSGTILRLCEELISL